MEIFRQLIIICLYYLSH